jgi:hypothetical protein
MAHLDQLQSNATVPLAVESVHLLLFVESRGEELLAPEGSVGLLGSLPDVEAVGVLNDFLVVASKVEGPNAELIEAVVNHGHVRVGRVSVDTLTLNIIEDRLLIIVFHWNDTGTTYSCPLSWLKGLQPLPIVILNETHVVDVVVEVGILLNALVEALEGIVKVGLLNNTVDD